MNWRDVVSNTSVIVALISAGGLIFQAIRSTRPDERKLNADELRSIIEEYKAQVDDYKLQTKELKEQLANLNNRLTLFEKDNKIKDELIEQLKEEKKEWKMRYFQLRDETKKNQYKVFDEPEDET